jgi:hypothetical protein
MVSYNILTCVLYDTIHGVVDLRNEWQNEEMSDKMRHYNTVFI